jgi:hypothetical protein
MDDEAAFALAQLVTWIALTVGFLSRSASELESHDGGQYS